MSKPETRKVDKRRPDDDTPGLGLLADAAWIADGDAPEEPEELDRLHDALRKDLRPRGFVEETLAETVAVCLWRKRRALIAERGLVTQRQTGAYRRKIDELFKEADFSYLPLHLRSAAAYQCNSIGIDEPLARLERLSGTIQNDGYLTEEEAKEAMRFFRDASPGMDPLGYSLWVYNREANPETRDALCPFSIERAKTAMLTLIEGERRRLLTLKEMFAEEEGMEREAEVELGSIPDAEAVRALAQYEASLDRQMYAALEQLEKLQRARMGEALYALARFAGAANDSQLRSLKKLTCARAGRDPDGTPAGSTIDALRSEVR